MTDKDEEMAQSKLELEVEILREKLKEKLDFQKELKNTAPVSPSFSGPYGCPSPTIIKRSPIEEEILKLQKDLMSPSLLRWHRFWYPIDREEDLRKLLKKARKFDKMLLGPRRRVEKALKEMEENERVMEQEQKALWPSFLPRKLDISSQKTVPTDKISDAEIRKRREELETWHKEKEMEVKFWQEQETKREEYDHLFKIVVVGDEGVGKTTLLASFGKGFFTEDYRLTIGVDFHVKTISIETKDGPKICKLQLWWLIGGLQRFKTERPMYYRGSLGALLVFDLTNFENFKQLPLWIEEMRADLAPGIPILVAGNKCDLREQTTVSHGEIDSLMRTYDLTYMEISAKTGEGVEECFHALTLLTLANWNKREKKN